MSKLVAWPKFGDINVLDFAQFTHFFKGVDRELSEQSNKALSVSASPNFITTDATAAVFILDADIDLKDTVAGNPVGTMPWLRITSDDPMAHFGDLDYKVTIYGAYVAVTQDHGPYKTQSEVIDVIRESMISPLWRAYLDRLYMSAVLRSGYNQ